MSDDMTNATDRYEALACEFYRDTGLMAPGKDQPAYTGGPLYEERWSRWGQWLSDQRADAALRAMAAENVAGQVCDFDLPRLGIARDTMDGLVLGGLVIAFIGGCYCITDGARERIVGATP